MDNWKVHLDATARSGSNFTIDKYQKLEVETNLKEKGVTLPTPWNDVYFWHLGGVGSEFPKSRAMAWS